MEIDKALRENIYLFYVIEQDKSYDFHTINRFHSQILKESICEVFEVVLSLLSEGGYVKLEY
jgi:hypothetical protein